MTLLPHHHTSLKHIIGITTLTSQPHRLVFQRLGQPNLLSFWLGVPSNASHTQTFQEHPPSVWPKQQCSTIFI